MMRLKHKNIFYLLALALSASGAVTYADPVSGSVGSGWQTWSSSALVVDSSSTGSGNPYWNNLSGDGSRANVGWCLTGGGNCPMPGTSPGAIPYWGNGSASSSLMYFTSSGNPVTATLQTIMTTQTGGTRGYDVFGYYIASGSGSAATASLTPLFNSASNVVGTTYTLPTIQAGASYGFYIENVQGSGTSSQSNYLYFMDSTSNLSNAGMPADNLQHFAVFNGGSDTYFIGDVDGDACQNGFQPGTSPCVPASQNDYNNLVVKLTTGTPEPASLTLMGAGLSVIAVLVRRKKLGSEN